MIWTDTYKQLGPGRKPEDVKAFVDGLRPNFKEKTKEVVRSLFLPSSDPKLVDMSSAPISAALPALESLFNNTRVDHSEARGIEAASHRHPGQLANRSRPP